ncbi:putative Cytochrome P450 [Seiridium cardinale]|uniref:Cytochrome P450 n=1 Tax=Seiridium cardinale TaxID=138064 RepID=A0ABR2YA92_9PEZI
MSEFDPSSYLRYFPTGHSILRAGMACVFITFGLYFAFVPNQIKQQDRRRKRPPPGPYGLPLVGNLYDLVDSEEVPLKVQEWYRKYRDIFYTRIGVAD